MLEDHPTSANADVEPGKSEESVSLEPASSSARPDSKPLSAALERIGKHTPDAARYRLDGEIARGGMGIIQRVWDGNLRRAVARKILGKTKEGSDPRKTDPRSVGRFLEEAQVTAQLEHPGIVPVHELGLDGQGKLYFTMRLVRGEDLHKIFEHVKTGAQGWNLTRALHVMLRVCEAMSYAHKKGVLHRDLKPANVMVGRFGEVYVMDWGLARVLGEHDTKDLRIAPEPQSSDVRTDRGSIDVDTPDSPLITMDGDVVGTPAYMSPEQARGEVEALGPATDIYSLGAMLYHLLAGHMPYVEPGTKPSARAIWHRVMERPPVPLAPTVPAELVAIVDKAMAREPAQRYASVLDLADDLRAYLELRVVRAHRTGARVELAKLVQRNRLAAASLAALLLVLISAGFSTAWIEGSRREVQARELQERTAANLVSEVDELWPIHPDKLDAMDRWLERARALADQAPLALVALREFEAGHETSPKVQTLGSDRSHDSKDDYLEELRDAYVASLEFLDTGVLPPGIPEIAADNELEHEEENRAVLSLELPFLEERLAAASEHLRTPGWRYLDVALEQEHIRLFRYANALHELTLAEGLIFQVEERRSEIIAIQESLAEHAEDWQRAQASIADKQECPLYGGMHIAPQLGLVPLGRNPAGLWEFWHVLSGERPQRLPSGAFRLTPSTGIILTLIPGGTFDFGAQDTDPDKPNYYPPEPGQPELHPAQEWHLAATLDAFFLSKYEVTQGQWIRLSGTNPSEYQAGDSFIGSPRFSRVHPLENVSWTMSVEVLARFGLTLPTEAQWERAARAGTTTKYSGATSWQEMLRFANILDAAYARAAQWKEGIPSFDDGYYYHGPVGSWPPNSWGLHELFGNVSEWCLDWYGSSCEIGLLGGPGSEHTPEFSRTKAWRGANYTSGPSFLPVCSRSYQAPDSPAETIGIRPSRALETSTCPLPQ
ncbi:MAG: bifunctional serine/threonine-protein kinase/formylglycine-generating enzyme family protein [Planctomycetota bacterium]